MAITNKELERAINKLKKNQNYRNRNKVLDAMCNASNDSCKENFLLAYGSLREGEFNYEYYRTVCGEESLVFIYNTEISHCKIYDFGMYPVAIGGNFKDKVTVDLMYCSDEVFASIKAMEEHAGYRLCSSSFNRIVEENNHIRVLSAPYYIATRALIEIVQHNEDKFPLIPGGDWSRYIVSVKEDIEQ